MIRINGNENYKEYFDKALERMEKDEKNIYEIETEEKWVNGILEYITLSIFRKGMHL